MDKRIAEALRELTTYPERHARNRFAHDVVEKYKRYGRLSEAQIVALVKSLQRDKVYADMKASPTDAKGPQGRVTVTGEVLSVKEKVTSYGPKLKMLVRLPDGAKVYASVPRGLTATPGTTVTFTATFTRSATDPSFSNGYRPEFGTGRPESSSWLKDIIKPEIKVTKVWLPAEDDGTTPEKVEDDWTTPEKPEDSGPSVLAKLLEDLGI